MADECEAYERDDENRIICVECYYENYRIQCEVCGESNTEDYFSENHFILSADDAKEQSMAAGAYRILDKPYYRTDGFSVSIFKDSVEFICEYKIEESANMICDLCVKKVINTSKATKC